MRRHWLVVTGVFFLSACLGNPSASPSPSPGAATSTPGSGATVAPSPSASPFGATAHLIEADVARVVVDPALATRAADAVTSFGLDLYHELAGGSGNLVVSPASVAIALAMARLGAAGTTAAEMDSVLHDLGAEAMSGPANALDAALASRTGAFKDTGGVDQDVVLRIANAQFVQYDLPLKPSFLEAIAIRYGAGTWQVDFRTNPEVARQAINAWVADHTEHRIPEILGPNAVTPAWRLALANAVYLKAAWLEPFDVEATGDGDFRLTDGTTVAVPFMHAVVVAPSAQGSGWSAIQLPYVGEGLAMLVIVPDDVAAFDATFDASVLRSILGSLHDGSVKLWLPKFDFESKVELSDALATMGMPTAFTGSADFSGITAAEALAISRIVHQANITVDEAGTEAAAATVIGTATSGGGEPPTLRVDRPFLFLIRDVPTGAVVFMGRVSNPGATN